MVKILYVFITVYYFWLLTHHSISTWLLHISVSMDYLLLIALMWYCVEDRGRSRHEKGIRV